ncbi:hypothetical protein DPX16_4664 [Anabarilius grahami]|uniref:Uncharacterized protein n=1 Tax=Anabarilius grahami TaxID=495550 RepID=A0A3N0Y159_ANAGA|nr:hypothetical protein DPX16_4664 [Anabarilius grahami]
MEPWGILLVKENVCLATARRLCLIGSHLRLEDGQWAWLLCGSDSGNRRLSQQDGECVLVLRMEKKVCVIQTDFHQCRPIIAIHSKPLAHVHPLQPRAQAEMRDRDELKKAIEQTDRLLSRVRQLEGENSELCKEKHEVFVRMRAAGTHEADADELVATKADCGVGSRWQRLGPKLPRHTELMLDSRRPSSTSILRLLKMKCLSIPAGGSS